MLALAEKKDWRRGHPFCQTACPSSRAPYSLSLGWEQEGSAAGGCTEHGSHWAGALPACLVSQDGVLCCVIKVEARLGQLFHRKMRSPFLPHRLTQKVTSGALGQLLRAIRTDFSDRYDEICPSPNIWQGRQCLSLKSGAYIARLEKAKDKEFSTTLG